MGGGVKRRDAGEPESTWESEGELAAALDRTTDAVFALDADLRYVYVNDAGERLTRRTFGVSRDELLGESMWDAFPQLTETELYRRCREATAAQESATFEEYYGPADAWFDVRLFPSETGLTVYVRDVSERKRREREFEQFESILDTITDGVYVTDEDSEFTMVNDAYAEMTGYEPADLRGEHVSLVLDEETCALTGDARRTMNRGESELVEAELLRRDGTTLPVEGTFTPFPLDGEWTGTAGVVRDVSDRKRLEAELDAVFDRITDGFYALDSELRVVYWNGEMESRLDVPADEVVGERLTDYFPEFSENDVYPRFVEALTTQEPVTFESYGERWEVWTEITVHPSEEGISVYSRNVTERKEREDELERYGIMVETASDGLYAVDADLRFTMVNEAFAEMTGYERDELLGSDLSLVVDESALRTGREARERLLAGERAVVTVADEIRRKDGERLPVEARIALLQTDGEHRETVGVTRDVSDRLAYERELEARTERLESIVESGPLVVYTLDTEGSFTLLEGAGLAALSLEPGDVVGESVFDVNADSPDIVASHRRALAGESVNATAEFEGVVFEYTCKPVFGDDGSVDRVIGVAFDVTEQTRYEGALTALHGTARRLLTVETDDQVFEEVVTAAEEIANLPFTCVYKLDEAAGVLEPTIYTDCISSVLRDAPTVPVEGSIVGTVFTTGTPATFDDIHDSPDLFDRSYPARSAMLVPLGRDSVLAAGSTEFGAFDERTYQLAELLAATAEAALDRIERERQLTSWAERLESVIENVPLAVHALDTDGRFTLSEGAGLAALGLDPGEIVGESIDDVFAGESELFDAYERALAGEPTNVVVEQAGVTFENGCRPILDADGSVDRVIGVALDITERAQYEGALAALHRSSRDLLNARTRDDVAAKVVEASTEVLDLTGIVVFLFDEADNVLRPAAYSPDVPEMVGEPPIYGPESSITWNTFVTGETTSYDDVRESGHVANPNTDTRNGLYIPLGDHGVLTVVSKETDVLTEGIVELVDLFAATAQTALDRVAREAAVRDHQWELEEQAARLEQLNDITEQLRSVERVLVFESTRDDIERAVCEQLTKSDRFAFAWIGDVEDDGGVTPRVWAGTERGYLDQVADPDEPAARTAATRERTVVENVADGLRRESWRSDALSRGYQSVISVPLVYDELAYGVLTVYAKRTDAFDAMFRTVLDELGDTIAYAIDAAETKHGLLTDGVVELDLRIPRAADPLAFVSREAGASTQFEGVVHHPDGARVFFSASGAPPERVVAVAEESVAVSSIRVVTDRGDDGGLFELTAEGPLIATTLIEHGALPREIETEGDGTRLVVELPRTDDVRSFVERLRTAYPGTELAARRDCERPVRSRETFRDELDAQLTDRQREVLRTAYLSGYFDTPRASTGEKVAASLDITQPTFANHLRAGERKLFELLYEEATS